MGNSKLIPTPSPQEKPQLTTLFLPENKLKSIGYQENDKRRHRRKITSAKNIFDKEPKQNIRRTLKIGKRAT